MSMTRVLLSGICASFLLLTAASCNGQASQRQEPATPSAVTTAAEQNTTPVQATAGYIESVTVNVPAEIAEETTAQGQADDERQAAIENAMAANQAAAVPDHYTGLDVPFGEKVKLKFDWTSAEIGKILTEWEDYRQTILTYLTEHGYKDFDSLGLVSEAGFDYWELRKTQEGRGELPLPVDEVGRLDRNIEKLSVGLNQTHTLLRQVVDEHADCPLEFRSICNEYWRAYRLLCDEMFEFREKSIEYMALWQARQFLDATSKKLSSEQVAELRTLITDWHDVIVRSYADASNQAEILSVLDEALKRLPK